MKVRELPGEDREKLYAFTRAAGCDPAEIEDLEVDEFALFWEAKIEDADRKIERQRQHMRLCSELHTLVDPVEAKHPGLPLSKATWFLPREQQQRVYAILRELNQQARPILVTRDRQPWHAAVERMIEMTHGLDFAREDGVHGFLVTSNEAMDAMIDYTALQVLKQNSSWPPDLVRRYAQQLLSTLGGLPR